MDLSHNTTHLLDGNTAGNVATAAPVAASPSTLNDATTALPVNVSDLTGTVNGLTGNLMGGSPDGLGL